MSARRRGRPLKGFTSTGAPIPGGGTKADIAHLSRTLGMTQEAVEAMMAAQGAGTSGGRTRRSGPPPASAPVATSSAWADFMSDEMDPTSKGKDGYESKMRNEANNDSSTKTALNDPEEENALVTATRSRDLTPVDDTNTRKEKKATSSQASYVLPLNSTPLAEDCVLAQTGTLDSTIIGRGSMNIIVRNVPKVDLCEPTLLFPKSIFSKIRIGSIAASSSSCHCIAVDTEGEVYGWGRNEDGQLGLGPDTPSICVPRKIPVPGKEKMQLAAVGKHHTILIAQDGGAFACGRNHLGQLGINSSIDSCNTFRRCMLVLTDNLASPDSGSKTILAKKRRSQKKSVEEGTVVVGAVVGADGSPVKFIQAACGENFSVVLSSTGHMYTTGSSEFGQLGNGATGEHFISASKIGFSNCNRFEPRSHFVTSEESSFSTGSDGKKVVLMEDIRISHISCGKYHTMAVEARKEGGNSDDGCNRRVFSWGCGDYGCLGHGVQVDEYYPRSLTFFRSKMFDKNPPVLGASGSQSTLVLTERGHGYYVGRHRAVGDATMRPTLLDALASNGHVVTGISGGAQTIVCCTKSGVTVTWGNGPYGDLGYGDQGAKSSSKPKFVSQLDSCLVIRVASGYGSSIFLIKDEDAEDKAALKKLNVVEKEDIDDFEAASMIQSTLKKEQKENRLVSNEGANIKKGKRKQSDGKVKGDKKMKS